MKNSGDRGKRAKERISYIREITINDTVKGKALDISTGGLYVYTEHTFREGEIVDLSLPLKDQTLRLKAKIKYLHPSIGVGLMFVDLDEKKKADIRKLVDYVVKEPPAMKETKTTVLLVDEDDLSRRMMRHELIAEGFWVIDAVNGIEALKTLGEHSVDIVVLDLFMKQMDGFKALSIIKQSPAWGHLPVIVLSAEDSDDITAKALSTGADSYLLKKVTSPVKLAKAIRSSLNRHDRQQEDSTTPRP